VATSPCALLVALSPPFGPFFFNPRKDSTPFLVTSISVGDPVLSFPSTLIFRSPFLLKFSAGWGSEFFPLSFYYGLSEPLCAFPRSQKWLVFFPFGPRLLALISSFLRLFSPPFMALGLSPFPFGDNDAGCFRVV